MHGRRQGNGRQVPSPIPSQGGVAFAGQPTTPANDMKLGLPGEQTARPRSPAEKLQPKRPPRLPGNRRSKVRRRRLNPFFRLINGLLTLTVLIMAGVGIGAFLLKTKFEATGPLAAETLVRVPRGRGVNAIADLLEENGVVTDSRLFVANVYYKRVQSKLKAGRYKLPAGASINEVVDKLVEGRAVTFKVTLPEGRTSEQIVAKLNKADHLSGQISLVPPEGTLLPDTYNYETGMARSDLLNRMRTAQQKLLDRLWETRQANLPLKSKQEVLILASIVEKETGIASERRRVAAVFVNRLRKRMRLQSDPTVIYGLVGGKGSLGHPIRRSELNRKTAYNTYQIDRLPPTPICNPGRAAIEATLNPASSNELFFVADGTGGHIFASTLKQHNLNVRNWRKIERERRANRKKAAKKAKSAKTVTAAVEALPIPVATGGPQLRSLTSEKPKLNLINNNGPAVSPAAKVGKIVTGSIPLPVRKPKKYRR